jgi:hypothetical protein
MFEIETKELEIKETLDYSRKNDSKNRDTDLES